MTAISTPKIMIFEDDPDQLFILERVLGRSYTVVPSSTLKDLAGQLREHRPHLVLIDNKIGLSLAEEHIPEIKQHDDLRDIPLILVSGHRDVAEMSKRVGASGYLQKPFSLTALREMVGKYLGVQA
jgi:DNA-binding NtrC family response regulator